jgi:hypothetical protein
MTYALLVYDRDDALAVKGVKTLIQIRKVWPCCDVGRIRGGRLRCWLGRGTAHGQVFNGRSLPGRRARAYTRSRWTPQDRHSLGPVPGGRIGRCSSLSLTLPLLPF